MAIVRVLAVTFVMAAGTWVIGWWAVPLIGAAYALLRGAASHVAREAAVGAVLAWSVLLLYQASNPAFGRLTAALAGVFPVPAVVLMLVSVLFAGVLAGSAARVAARSEKQ